MEAKVKESRFIDYKRDLPSSRESDIKDFLVDVSAFANFFGGTILFGIEEDKGEPIACPGVGDINTDEVKRRLSSILENSLDPPLRGFDFETIKTPEGKLVLVLRINQSPSAPHMLNKGSRKFYSRGVAGNVPMGSYEIRAAFLASEGMSEKVRNFVQQRCRLIEAREIDFDLSERAQTVFHIIPIEAFSRPRNLAMAELNTIKQFAPAVASGSYGRRYCLDGIAATSGCSENKILSYSLLFRNGCVEATCPCRYGDIFQEKRVAERFADAAPKYEEILRTFGFAGPFFVSLTILACKGTRIDIDPFRDFGLDVRPINTDFLSLPILEWVEEPVVWLKVLRHFCDLCSNAMGFPFSLSFKNDGSLQM